MKRTHVVVCALLACLSFCYGSSAAEKKASPEAVGMSGGRLALIAPTMKSYIDSGWAPGCVTLIARHGRIIHCECVGYRDSETKEPLAPDTIFRIASMSKPITAVAVMMLYEEGRLLLTDPVSKYIPEFADPKVLVKVEGSSPANGKSYAVVPAQREITIRNLLNHTSGISYGGGPQQEIYELAGIVSGLESTRGSIGDMVRRLGSLPLAHNPGDSWTYGLSNDVLGYLVEVVSGQTFDQFLATRIFTPLKMNDSFIRPPKEKFDRIAVMYTHQADGSMKRQTDSDRAAIFQSQQSYFSGGAGVYSTALDYWRFAQMLLNGGELDGVRILSRKSVELMTSDSTGGIDILAGTGDTRATHGDRYGLGLGIRSLPGDIESIGTYGWGGAFHTLFWVDPNEDMIGIFMSQLGSMSDKTQHRVFRMMAYSAIEK